MIKPVTLYKVELSTETYNLLLAIMQKCNVSQDDAIAESIQEWYNQLTQ
jgi:hypothetical protein